MNRRFLFTSLVGALSVGLAAACGSASRGNASGSGAATSSTSAGAAGATTSSSSGTTNTTSSSGSTAQSSSGSGTGGAATTASSSSGAGAGTTSSSSGTSGVGGGCTTDPTFAEVLAGPLSNCSGLEPPCHNAGAAMLKIQPTMQTATWKQLVNVPTYTVGAGIRVVPGDAKDSFLYRKLTDDLGPNDGLPMPQPLLNNPWKELPAADIEMVKCWILAGAKND